MDLGLAFAGFVAGVGTGCGSRLSGVRHEGSSFVRNATIGWWILTYPADQPGAGAVVAGASVGHLAGEALALLIETVRAAGGGRGRPPEDESPEPWDPDPDGVVAGPESEFSDLTTADFVRETRTPAPAEPVRENSPRR